MCSLAKSANLTHLVKWEGILLEWPYMYTPNQFNQASVHGAVLIAN